jgi:hypothetical protein
MCLPEEPPQAAKRDARVRAATAAASDEDAHRDQRADGGVRAQPPTRAAAAWT